MSFDFGEECKRYQVSQAFAKQVDEKLFPLLERAIQISTFNMFISQKLSDSQDLFRNFEVFLNLTEKIRKRLDVSPKEFAFLFLISYLVVAESLYKLMVDIIAFALINVGEQMRDERTGKCVILFDELEKITLGPKLDFLRANRFKIIAKCNISLRNAAAHLNFKIDNEGNIIYKGGLIKVFDDMNKFWEEIRKAAVSCRIALGHFYYEKYGKYML